MSNKNLYKIKGDKYEEFVVESLKNEYDNIWLWKDVPESILICNKIIIDYGIYSETRKDIGIDIVAVKDGICEYIQCKNYEANVCLNDISGFLFFMILNNVNGTLCYSNGISKNIIDSINDKDQILKLKIRLRHIPFEETEITGNNLIKHQPRYYQLEAINLISNENNKKTILKMPCGTGKTFTISGIAKSYHNVILIAPLRKLAVDILNNMKGFLGIKYKKILISSDGTRDVIKIKNMLGVKNIFGCTYDSVDVLNEIFDSLINPIIIVDEYHNLTSKNLNNKTDAIYKLLQNDCKIVYLSATPNMTVEHDAIYEYKWDQAINDGNICDFNITIPTADIIDDDNLNKMLKLLNNINEIDEKMIKKGYFIVKSLLYNGNRKCIVYLTTINKANIFKNVLEGLTKLLNIEIDINIVTTKTTKMNRDVAIHKFKNSNILSIILNVHILDEGIDIPECDSVFVTQPNNNIINLIQRMCRCNRVTENKKKKKCNMYLWCTEKKTQKVLDYIRINTIESIAGKINKYDPIKNCTKIKKHKYANKNDHVINAIMNEIFETLEQNYIMFDTNKISLIIDTNSVVWFNANETALALGYDQPKMAIINNVDKEDKNQLRYINTNQIIKKHPHSVYISESGLYSLLLQSRLPKAKKFKKMVT